MLAVQDLTVFAPGNDRPIVFNVSFKLEAGMGLALLGPSASGKSSLARALVGIWPTAHGKVRLDGASLDQWNCNDLGQHLGYLPQDVALFDGTVADNIARFDASASSESIIEAAHIAGAHEMILRLPLGYETQIGEGGASLSSGQRQRIGLARAVFGGPFLVVLDEPDANLDVDGEKALTHTILTLRTAGKIPIVISHRANVLAALNMALVLHTGRMIAFGTRDNVFEQMARSFGRQVPSAPLGEVLPAGMASKDDRLPRGAQHRATV
jgi:ABC-type protease/lipase transport system fused ATPase/permease subunit